MVNNKSVKGTSCCSGASNCCDSKESTTAKRNININIDFMYLDLSVCDRCQGTDESLDAALFDVTTVLKAAGIETTVNKIHIDSEKLACQLRFASSPTIRVNGHDIQMEAKESLCESCGDLCGDDVDCRVWVYQGKEYTIPPKAMIVDAILREVYGTGGKSSQKTNEDFVLPDNLKRFFQSIQCKNDKKIWQ